MQTCPEVLYKLHMVSLDSVPTLYSAPESLPKTQSLGVWQKVKRLEFFNWPLGMNLLVKWNTEMHLVLQLSSL